MLPSDATLTLSISSGKTLLPPLAAAPADAEAPALRGLALEERADDDTWSRFSSSEDRNQLGMANLTGVAGARNVLTPTIGSRPSCLSVS